MNLNGVYMRRGQRIEQHGEQHAYNWFFANVSNTFSLPARFYIDCAYFYQGRIDLGTIWLLPSHSLQAGIKKRFGEQFLLSFSVRGILDQDQRVGAGSDEFVRTVKISQAWGKIQYRFGVTWNFQSGKAFRKRAVEAASAEDRERLSKGSGTGF